MIHFSASSSSNSTSQSGTANSQPTSLKSPAFEKHSRADCSDSEESFKSLDSDDVSDSDEPEASSNQPDAKAAAIEDE